MPVEKSLLFILFLEDKGDRSIKGSRQVISSSAGSCTTLRTSAIYYVLTRKVHYSRVLSCLVSLGVFTWRDAPLDLPKFKGLVGRASSLCLANGRC